MLSGGAPRQVGGEFLFEGGKVLWCHRMRNTRDHAEIPELKQHLGLLPSSAEDDEMSPQEEEDEVATTTTTTARKRASMSGLGGLGGLGQKFSQRRQSWGGSRSRSRATVEKAESEKAGSGASSSPAPAPVMDEVKEETTEDALAKLEGVGGGAVRLVGGDDEEGEKGDEVGRREKVGEGKDDVIVNGTENGNGKVEGMMNGTANGTAVAA